jgi:hypothetical protein
MANTIIAGNGTNNGLAVTSDNTGALNILTGSGAGTAAISIDDSQNVTMAANLSVTGNTTITGTLTASGGVSGSIASGTSVSASGTSVDFTSLPTGVKRITIMFNGISTNGSSNILVQLGDSGGIENTSYIAISAYSGGTNLAAGANATTGFLVNVGASSATTFYGSMTLCLQTGTTWVASHTFGIVQGAAYFSVHGGGTKALSATLDRVRITTVNGTDTFDAGTVNILWE